MYKNIIFDLGGVMVDFDPKSYLVDRICNVAMEDLVYDITFGSDTWKALDAGLIDRQSGNQKMMDEARRADCAFEVQAVLDDWLHILHIRPRMVELVKRLKQSGYNVYYLSNIPQDVLDLLMAHGLDGVFDGGVTSCEVHINKPDPGIYRALLKKYNLKAKQSIFIDDRQENIHAAFSLGFAGMIMKENAGTLARSLETYNIKFK